MHNRNGWTNPAHRGAFDKGAAAYREGKPTSACPYRDTRKDDGRLTGSRGFRNAWYDGHRSAAASAQDEGAHGG